MSTSHTAGWTSASPTPAQFAEFFRQVQSGRISKERLQSFLRGDGKPTGYDLANLILGDDFISPEEVVTARNLTYSDALLEHLAQTMPSEDVLRWCRENDYLVVPQPPEQFSLLDVRSVNPTLFYTPEGGWYEEASERFSREDKVTTPWVCIRKGAVPNSTRKTFEEQQKLLGKDERVPNVGEVAWAFTTYKEVRGIYLVPDLWVRTSSVASDGLRVHVGDFDENGLNVGDWWDDDRYNLGVASARKF